jgi:5-methyltetrahydropteroyltriglutamate--homocysteine methyltransferase
MIDAHAEMVGSLLRPPELLGARKELASGAIEHDRFKRIEDRAVNQAIVLQEEVGLTVITDGEMRRESFQSPVPASMSGFGEFGLDAFLWGDWYGEHGVKSIPRPPGMGAVARLARRGFPLVEEFTYLKARTWHTPKITLPSPGLWANFWSRDRSRNAYPTLDSFLSDMVTLLREEVGALAGAGARYIQLDAPHYGLLLDSKTRGFYEGQGWSLDQWLSLGIELDNAVMRGFPEVTFGLHV